MWVLIVLLVFGGVLLYLKRTGRIPKNLITDLAEIATILAFIAAALIFIIPAATSEPESISAVPLPASIISTSTSKITPTLTSGFSSSDLIEPSPTLSFGREGDLLFEDDFERDYQIWMVDSGTWKVRGNDGENHFYCIDPKGLYGFVHVGSPGWGNYAVEIDFMVLNSKVEGIIDARVIYNPFSAYEFYFGNKWISISRRPEDSSKGIPLDGTEYEFDLRKWYSTRIEVFGSNIRVFNQNEKVLQAIDESPLEAGSIRIGASGEGEICWDNVRVIALNP